MPKPEELEEIDDDARLADDGDELGESDDGDTLDDADLELIADLKQIRGASAPDAKKDDPPANLGTQAANPNPPPVDPADDDDANIPPGPRELRAKYKETAKALREREQVLADRERELSELRQIQQHQVEQSRVKQPDEYDKLAVKFTADQLASLVGRIDAGLEEGTPAQLADSRKRALAVMMRKPITEISKTHQRAMNGEFGEFSVEVEAAAQGVLLNAMATEEGRKAEAARTDGWRQERNTAWKEVLAFEGMRQKPDGSFDLDTENGKRWAAAAQELAQLIPNIETIPRAPLIALEYAKLKHSANDAQQIPALKAEIESLKKQLAKATGPVPAGRAGAGRQSQRVVQSGEALDDADLELKENLRSLGFTRR